MTVGVSDAMDRSFVLLIEGRARVLLVEGTHGNHLTFTACALLMASVEAAFRILSVARRHTASRAMMSHAFLIVGTGCAVRGTKG